METKQVDWATVEKHASEMEMDALRYAIQDIRDTLEHADALDRADGGDRGGYYRDEASIYWREIRRRQRQK